MGYSEDDMITSDYEDLSDADLMVLLIVGCSKTILRTRLQKISLLYRRIYKEDEEQVSHNAYFFGGYSDEIDEAAHNLTDIGIIEEKRSGYALPEYGDKLMKFVVEDGEEECMVDGIFNIVKSLRNIPDKNVVGLTYHYYGETAINSTIKSSVERLNATVRYNGLKLDDISKEQFEKMLRNGDVLRISN